MFPCLFVCLFVNVTYNTYIILLSKYFLNFATFFRAVCKFVSVFGYEYAIVFLIKNSVVFPFFLFTTVEVRIGTVYLIPI